MIHGRNLLARFSLQSKRREMSVIETSPEEALSLFRKWQEEKARLRFVAALKSLTISATCSVMSVSTAELGLLLSRETRSVCATKLAGCEFSFGTDDAPQAERDELGLSLDAGVSVFTPHGESFWLVEMAGRSW